MTSDRSASARANGEPFAECSVDLLKGAELGQSTSVKLHLPDGYLDRDSRVWVKTGESNPYVEINRQPAALPFTWEQDLQPMDLICVLPAAKRYFNAQILLPREPAAAGVEVSPQFHIAASGNAVVYMPEPRIEINTGAAAASCVTLKFDRKALIWKGHHLPEAHWQPQIQPFDLLVPTDRLHLVVAFTNQLIVGRLHCGNQRHLNQSKSGKGAHWHLGWQWQVVDPYYQRGHEAEEPLHSTARGWMRRQTCILRLDPKSKDFDIEAIAASADVPAQEFRLLRIGSCEWQLTLRFQQYVDALVLRRETLAIDETGAEVPWFWAARCGVVPDLEDRFYLWFPWSRDALARTSAAQQRIGSEVRWSLLHGSVHFTVENPLFYVEDSSRPTKRTRVEPSPGAAAPLEATRRTSADHKTSDLSTPHCDGRGKRTIDVFICYSSANISDARLISHKLKERGLNVWIDKEEIAPGRRWRMAIEGAIQRSHSAAILIGKDGLGPWGSHELEIFLSEAAYREVIIVPILLPDVPEIPMSLRPFRWIDLRDGIEEDGIDLIVWGITGRKPATGNSDFVIKE